MGMRCGTGLGSPDSQGTPSRGTPSQGKSSPTGVMYHRKHAADGEIAARVRPVPNAHINCTGRNNHHSEESSSLDGIVSSKHR